ncbi:Polyadenylation factor subunit 2 [Endocarpon pusillum Z07020]|uniref:Polyadenylation factor subunit 2 n=1 Tax=Endocarpon pusillum (strain Z07020 / HMAS-L-300199) TaxID=1263415 RepID=U1FV13_ENDPU|nr:Polyadenylation factor subunit 2 [Endocarpon pusillum Z07020]ERF68627.1 Polyadenylation factor subunit 2 [Endocarpon pusillum Z07020]
MAANGYEYEPGGDGFANRRRRPRPVTDYGSSLVQYMRSRRPRYRGSHHLEAERPSPSYIVDVLPPAAKLDCPADAIPVRHLHSSLGKSKKPVTVVRWMPEGRRLLAGVHNGEFMLWNGMAFNFETVTAVGSSSLRAAEWSHKRDWLLAANDEGIVYYLQPTLNNPHKFQAHAMPVRDLAFAPSDSKFVTASDDATLKIWDFTTSNDESTLQGHNWDAKCCDWHPSKGLIVSGSKDHSVKLWDPRSTRNLTTLHSHKNALTATVFSRLRDQLLATAGRDNLARIFDLRMMRDVCVLRGHEKGITAVSWHPVHSSLLSTGSDDGSIHSYLLDEPNPPVGVSTSEVSPYNSLDPSSTPAQSIYPAHRISHAHESSVWSLDWHPLGHILASGSNDHFTRFWSRARPGETNCFKDQYHLGEEGAEAQGTWDRKYGRKQAREQEEQELEDEAEGLEDQRASGANTAFSIPGLPIPGINGSGSNLLPGMGHVPPPPVQAGSAASMPSIAGMDPTRLAQLFPQANPGFVPPPPPPGAPGGLPVDFSKLQLPAGFKLPPGFPPPPVPGGFPQGQPNGLPGLVGNVPGLNGAGEDSSNGGIRRRAPLPSQQESLMAEQRRGNFRISR